MNANVKGKKAGRKRRAAGWTLLVLGVLVAGVWAASGWWRASRIAGWYAAHIQNGVVCREQFGPFVPGKYPDPRPWRFSPIEDYPGTWKWRATYGFAAQVDWSFGVASQEDLGGVKVVTFVLWPIPLLLWTPAALFLRSGTLARRRANKGACPKCGYSLAGIVEGSLCPECGRGAATTK
ncbi:MAG: hypothetical protein QM783_17260 [Phycisphaerales bacterium]